MKGIIKVALLAAGVALAAKVVKDILDADAEENTKDVAERENKQNDQSEE